MSGLSGYLNQRIRQARRTRLVTLFFAFVLVLSSVALAAGQVLERDAAAEDGYQWNYSLPAGELEGADRFYAIAASDASDVVITSGIPGTYRSEDGGVTWSLVSEISASNAESLVMSGDGQYAMLNDGQRVYLSSDSGETWEAIQQGVVSSSVTRLLSSASGDVLLVVTHFSVYASYDYGATWSALPIETDGWYGADISDDGNTIILARSSGQIVRSADRGAAWSNLYSVGSYIASLSLSGDGNVIHAVSGYMAWISRDAGLNWSTHTFNQAASFISAESNYVGDRMAFVMVQSNVVYVYTSTNYGQTLRYQTLVDQPAQGQFSRTGIAIDSLGEKIYTTIHHARMYYAEFNPTVPLPVTQVRATGTSSTTGRLIWYVPTDSGGYSYQTEVEYRQQGTDTWLDAGGEITIDEVQIVAYDFDGLQPGVNYEVRISSVNQIGRSEYTYASFATPLVMPPSSPIQLSAIGGESSVYLSWQVPASDGGSAITGYEAQYRTVGASQWSASVQMGGADATSGTIESLLEGTAYEVRLRAYSEERRGDWIEYREVQSLTHPYGAMSFGASDDGQVMIVNSLLNLPSSQEWRNTVSLDAGATWSDVTIPPVLEGAPVWSTPVGVQPDGNRLIVGYSQTGDGGITYINRLFASTDDGVSWSEIYTKPVSSSSSSIAGIDVAHDGSILIITGGNTAVVLNADGTEKTTLTAGEGFPLATYVFDDESNVIMTKISASYNQSEVLLTKDLGASWELLSATGPGEAINYRTQSADGVTHIIKFNLQSSTIRAVRTTDEPGRWQGLEVEGVSALRLPLVFGDSIYLVSSTSNQPITVFKRGVIATTLGESSIPENPVANLNGQSLENNPTFGQTLSFSGRAQAYDQITVTVHSDPVSCSATADAQGFWSCQISGLVEPGAHTVNIQVTSALDGSVTTLGPYAITVVGESDVIDSNTPLTPGAPNTGLLGLPLLPQAPSSTQSASSNTWQLAVAILLGSLTAVGVAAPFLYRHHRKALERSNSL